MTNNQIQAVDASIDTIRRMLHNRDRMIKGLVLVLLLTWVIGGYHIFVQLPKMKANDAQE